MNGIVCGKWLTKYNHGSFAALSAPCENGKCRKHNLNVLKYIQVTNAG